MNLLRQGNFLLYFIPNSLSLLGTWIQKIGLGWLAWQVTESTFWTSFVSLALMAPTGIFAPFIAVYAENWDMRRAMLVTKCLTLAVSLVIFGLQIAGLHTTTTLVILSLAMGVLAALHHPIRLVFIAVVVPKQYLPSAIGLNSVSWNVSRIVGPGIAGFLIALSGLEVTFGVAAALYVPLIIALFLLTLTPRPAVAAAGSFAARMREGIAFVMSSKIIGLALGVVALNSFFVRGILEIQPAIVGQILEGDSSALAVVTIATGIGSLLGSLWLGLDRIGEGNITRLLWPMLFGGLLCGGGFFVATEIVSMAILFTICGLTATVVGIGAQTIIQINVAENVRSRVMTWWATTSFASLTLGGILIGALGDAMPIEYAILGMALTGLVIAAVVCLRRYGHKIRRRFL